MNDPARQRFLEVLGETLGSGTLVKLTLGKHRGSDSTLRTLHARQVILKSGPRVACTWRHETRDIVKNLPSAEALQLFETLLGGDFLDAHLFTQDRVFQFQGATNGKSRFGSHAASDSPAAPPPAAHDREKAHLIPAMTPWLRSLGIVGDHGQPLQGQAHKFRQINKFAEILQGLISDGFKSPESPTAIRVVDMGSGKGYLTFAVASLLGTRATVTGIEQRPELVELCNRVAKEHSIANLRFEVGKIEDTIAGDTRKADVLIALHACDTATDEAIAHGIGSGSRLIVVAPCCQKEVRPRMGDAGPLAPVLRHGIFRERQAEFATDALRTLLLEWSGYRTRAIEFVSTEHTSKNLMIAAVLDESLPKRGDPGPVRDLAGFFGIREQRLADRLGFRLGGGS
jgi:SAM-dependent methyltransferase